MSQNTSIEWTDATWNPATGCTEVSPGCRNCYAKRFAERFRGVANHPFEQGFDLKLWPDRLDLPLHWRKPRRIFVNSMSDLFHPDIPDDYVYQVFTTMSRANWHVFQVLTKRSERLLKMANSLPWPPQIWMGVSIESDRFSWRADHLRQVPANVRFISAEPLLGPLDQLDLNGVHWLITGGESGPKFRECKLEWVQGLRDRCVTNGVAFFHKQWGGLTPSARGRLVDGRTWNQYPVTGSQVQVDP